MNPWLLAAFGAILGLMQAWVLADVRDLRDRIAGLEDTCRNQRRACR